MPGNIKEASGVEQNLKFRQAVVREFEWLVNQAGKEATLKQENASSG
jgi:hypothetical protein